MFKKIRYALAFTLVSFTAKATDVLTLIQESNIQYKGIASKIAVLETGNFKSKLYKNHNNAFGFKRNSRKLYSKTINGYCAYASLELSVEDYMRWEKAMVHYHKIHTRSQFLSFLNRIYSASHNYSKKLETVKIPPVKRDSSTFKSLENFLSLAYPLNQQVVKRAKSLLPQFVFLPSIRYA